MRKNKTVIFFLLSRHPAPFTISLLYRKAHSRSEEEALDSEKVVNVFLFLGGKRKKKQNKKMGNRKKMHRGILLYPCGDSCLNLILTRLLAACIEPPGLFLRKKLNRIIIIVQLERTRRLLSLMRSDSKKILFKTFR